MLRGVRCLLLLLVVLLPAPLHGVSGGSEAPGRPRLRREPPKATKSGALWPDSPASGKPLPRAKPIAGLNPSESTWGGGHSVWIPLDAVFDAHGWEEAGMRLSFNDVHAARVGMRVRVVSREELQRCWQNYNGKSVLQKDELANLTSQADRVGAILELDLEDKTAKIKIDPVEHKSNAEL
eukprot:COSAG02_NODE_12882_length_1477_cov_1.344702_1_plen_180_part_00